MKKVILDTNILVYCVKFKIDFVEELKRILDFNFEVYILEKSLDELSKLKEKNLVLELINKKEVKILNIISKDSVDDILVKLSKSFIVGTQDKELKGRLSKPYITIRQKKYFVLVG